VKETSKYNRFRTNKKILAGIGSYIEAGCRQMPAMFAVILQQVTQKWTNDSDLKEAGAAVPLGAGIVELCSGGV